MDDLFGPGAKPGTVPTDMEQATGLERLEILGKMEGVDVFDMRPLDSSRRGMSIVSTCRQERWPEGLRRKAPPALVWRVGIMLDK